MTSTHQEKQPIDDLLSRLLDDKLDDGEREQLMDLLQYDPDARELYHEHIALHAMLHWIDCEPLEHVADESPLVRMAPSDTLPTSRTPILGFLGDAIHSTMSYSFDGWPLAYLVATVIVVTGLVFGGLISVPTVTQVARESAFPVEFWRNAAAPKVGRITATLDCSWADGSPVARDGDYVSIGRPFALDAGLLEITYETGAKVILQGPVTYAVASANSGFLSSGKLVGKMTTEKAKGFAVGTPTATVVDLGTEFGVEVDDQGGTRSHVFAGTVRVMLTGTDSASQSQTMDLHANDSVSIEKKSDAVAGVTTVRGVAEPERFVRSEELAKAVNRQKLQPFTRWQSHAEAMRRDPALVVFYDFQQRADSPEVLHAEANGSVSPLDGVIQGATWGSGRVHGKQALHFDGNQASVRVNLPSRMTQMTLATWVTIESINSNDLSCGLLMSDGWVQSANAAEKVHWQIGPGGELFFGSCVWDGMKTSPVLPWQEWGANRWRHVAAVADPAHQKAYCYLDGKEVLAGALPDTFAATFGSALIGSWQVEDGGISRVFHGRMDELLILSRAMTDREIKELYESGKR